MKNYSPVLKFLFVSFYLSLSSFYSYAGDQPKKIKSELEALIEKAESASDNRKYGQALEYFAKAEALAEKTKQKDKIYHIKNYLGTVYSQLSNYGESLGYYKQAIEIAKSTAELEERIPIVLSNIGILYTRQNDPKMALEYFKKSYELTKKKNFSDTKRNGYFRVTLAVNLSDWYNKNGNFKAARKYLSEVEAVPKTKNIEQLWKINYAESFVVEGKIAIGQKLAEQLLKDIDKQKESGCYSCVIELLSEIYSNQGKQDMAIQYMQKGLQNTKSLTEKINFYDHLSDFYFRKNEYNISRKYKDSVIITKDSLSSTINRELFEINKVKLKIQDYQNELKANKEKYASERKLLIIGIAFSLLLSFFIYRWLKNRILKQKQEKIIAENQQKIISLEMEGLKNNIAEKNRKLSAKALYLSGRNELIEEVINSLAKIPEVFQNREVANYIKTLKEYLKTDAEWDDFIAYFEQVNHDFFRALKTNHPQLTPQDIRFLCYIYMNLDIKEISTIFSITAEAGRKRKQRIAKKMNVDIDDLHEYILKIH